MSTNLETLLTDVTYSLSEVKIIQPTEGKVEGDGCGNAGLHREVQALIILVPLLSPTFNSPFGLQYISKGILQCKRREKNEEEINSVAQECMHNVVKRELPNAGYLRSIEMICYSVLRKEYLGTYMNNKEKETREVFPILPVKSKLKYTAITSHRICNSMYGLHNMLCDVKGALAYSLSSNFIYHCDTSNTQDIGTFLYGWQSASSDAKEPQTLIVTSGASPDEEEHGIAPILSLPSLLLLLTLSYSYRYRRGSRYGRHGRAMDSGISSSSMMECRIGVSPFEKAKLIYFPQLQVPIPSATVHSQYWGSSTPSPPGISKLPSVIVHTQHQQPMATYCCILPQGSCHPVTLDPLHTTVANLKQIIGSTWGLPSTLISLHWQGKNLDHWINKSSNLLDIGLSHNDTIRLHPAIKGGMQPRGHNQKHTFCLEDSDSEEVVSTGKITQNAYVDDGSVGNISETDSDSGGSTTQSESDSPVNPRQWQPRSITRRPIMSKLSTHTSLMTPLEWQPSTSMGRSIEQITTILLFAITSYATILIS